MGCSGICAKNNRFWSGFGFRLKIIGSGGNPILVLLVKAGGPSCAESPALEKYVTVEHRPPVLRRFGARFHWPRVSYIRSTALPLSATTDRFAFATDRYARGGVRHVGWSVRDCQSIFICLRPSIASNRPNGVDAKTAKAKAKKVSLIV